MIQRKPPGGWQVALAVAWALAASAFFSDAFVVRGQTTNEFTTTTGAVWEATDEWILLQRPGLLPRRYPFDWIGNAAAAPDPETLAIASKLKRGDRVEVHWVSDDHERIEWLTLPGIAATPRPPVGATNSVSSRVPPAVSKPTKTGTTTGSLMERTDEWILVQPPDALPLRHWFKAFGAASSDDSRKVASGLEIGEEVAVRWFYDDRERIESLKLANAPVSAATNFESTGSAPPDSGTAEAGPATATTDSGPHGMTLAESVNTWIDEAVAFGDRILELPLFLVLGGVGVFGIAVGLVSARMLRKRPMLARGLVGVEVALVLATLTLIVDRKIARLQSAFTELQTRTSANAATVLGLVSKLEAKRHNFLVDPAEVQKSLAKYFRDVSLRPLIYDDTTDLIQFHTKSPLVQAYVAIIDLRNPAVEIRMDGTFDQKRLTTVFAREMDCTVAINGEAGTAPGPGSGLGPWRGNMVYRGQVLLREDPNYLRPYLAFDGQNHASFVAAAAKPRSWTTNHYNVLWGRLDLIVNGLIQGGDAGNRQPRTAMAINKEGTLLFLLVADGRQPNYSVGFTRAEVGQCLKTFGAQNAMLCDEGGSSCIYLKQFGGIANIPADNNGEERPTYTHFGIGLRSEK